MNPEFPRNRLFVWRSLAALHDGRYAEAVSLMQGARRERNARPPNEWLVAQMYFYHGERDETEQMLAGLRRGGEPDVRAQATLASFLAHRGEKTRAEELVRVVLARPSLEHHAAYSVGAAYVQLGRPAEALPWLRRAYQTGWRNYPWYARDPLLRPLDRNQEFQALLREMRESWEAARTRYQFR